MKRINVILCIWFLFFFWTVGCYCCGAPLQAMGNLVSIGVGCACVRAHKCIKTLWFTVFCGIGQEEHAWCMDSFVAWNTFAQVFRFGLLISLGCFLVPLVPTANQLCLDVFGFGRMNDRQSFSRTCDWMIKWQSHWMPDWRTTLRVCIKCCCSAYFASVRLAYSAYYYSVVAAMPLII